MGTDKWLAREPLRGREKRRYVQLYVAALLGCSLAGSLLIYAFNHASEPIGWVLLVGWVVVFPIAFTIAWRRYRATDWSTDSTDGADSTPESNRTSQL